MKWLETLLDGIIAGALVMFATGMIFFLLEQKWPILRGQTESEKDRFFEHPFSDDGLRLVNRYGAHHRALL